MGEKGASGAKYGVNGIKGSDGIKESDSIKGSDDQGFRGRLLLAQTYFFR